MENQFQRLNPIVENIAMSAASPKLSHYSISSSTPKWSFLENVVNGILPLLFAIISFVCTFLYHKRSSVTTHSSCTKSNTVPFIVFQEPHWAVLHKCAEDYRVHNLRLLQALSQGLDLLQNSEEFHNIDKMADRWQDRIDRLSGIFDQDQNFLQRQLFVPFHTTYVLPDGEQTIATKEFSSSDQRNCSADHSYDDPHQVVAHIVRDWTVAGKTIRRQLYDW